MENFINHCIYPLCSLILFSIIGFIYVFYSKRINFRVKYVKLVSSPESFLVSLSITNTSHRLAKDCIGYIKLNNESKITISDIVDSKDALEDEFLPTYKDEGIALATPRTQWLDKTNFHPEDQIALCWNYSGDPYQVDINPDASMSLALFRLQYHNDMKLWYFLFPTEKGWRRIRFRMKFKYIKGKIYISTSHTKPLIIGFTVTHRTNDSAPEVEIEKSKVVVNQI